MLSHSEEALRKKETLTQPHIQRPGIEQVQRKSYGFRVLMFHQLNTVEIMSKTRWSMSTNNHQISETRRVQEETSSII